MKQIVFVHGLGEQDPDYWKPWETPLRAALPGKSFTVTGLYWGDLLLQVQTRFPLEQDGFAQSLAGLGLGPSNATSNPNYQLASLTLGNLILYGSSADMRQYLLDSVTLRLNSLCGADAGDCILIGHSLGGVLLPHLLWQAFMAQGALAYGGLFLLAPLLGLHWNFGPFEDPLSTLAAMGQGGQDRDTALAAFVNAWSLARPGALQVVINHHDPTCWELTVAVDNPVIKNLKLGTSGLQRAFSASELGLLRSAGCLIEFAAGDTAPQNLLRNNAVPVYLGDAGFLGALGALL